LFSVCLRTCACVIFLRLLCVLFILKYALYEYIISVDIIIDIPIIQLCEAFLLQNSRLLHRYRRLNNLLTRKFDESEIEITSHLLYIATCEITADFINLGIFECS